MTDQKILAIVLVGATGFLLILVIITLCVIVHHMNKKKKPLQSQIPMSNRNYHSYQNIALDREGIYTTPITKTERAESKHESPTKYNMHSMSYSQVSEERGESSSDHDNHSQPSTGQKSSGNHKNYSPPSCGVSTISREISHKTFSEEVFEGVKAVNPEIRKPATPEPKNEETGSQTRGQGIWKYNPPEKYGQHSGDQHSIGTNSTASYQQSLPTQQPSYYSTFKPRTVHISKSDGSTAASNPPAIVETSHRQRITTETVETSGNKKIFTFHLQ